MPSREWCVGEPVLVVIPLVTVQRVVYLHERTEGDAQLSKVVGLNDSQRVRYGAILELVRVDTNRAQLCEVPEFFRYLAREEVPVQ